MAQQAYTEWSKNVASKIASGVTPYDKQHGPIPEDVFQENSVQKKIEELAKTNNASLKKRLPTNEKAPYFTKNNVKEYLEVLSRSVNKLGKIYFEPKQPRSVFYELGKMTNSYDFKVHLMFNTKYLFYVLHAIFHYIIAPYSSRLPFIFKVLTYMPVRSIAGQAGVPIPIIEKTNILNFTYGVNNTEKDKHARLAESFIYSPSEIKKYPVAYKDKDDRSKLSHTYKLTAKTRKNKIFNNEPFEFETVFDPVIVFYTKDHIYTRDLINILLDVFPDKYTSDIVLSNYYPRSNVKINNMIYFSNGDYTAKYGKMNCSIDPENGPQCTGVHRIGDLPTEYEEIQDSCSDQKEEKECHAANRFPMAISNHKLCEWKSDQCMPNKTYSSHLLLNNFYSLEDLYNTVGQSTILNEFKEKANAGQLPVNYNNVNQNEKNDIENSQDNAILKNIDTNHLHILSWKTQNNRVIQNSLYRAPLFGYIPMIKSPGLNRQRFPEVKEESALQLEDIKLADNATHAAGGRRTRHKKRKNKNKSRRAH